jgi:hypothetical protein
MCFTILSLMTLLVIFNTLLCLGPLNQRILDEFKSKKKYLLISNSIVIILTTMYIYIIKSSQL